jgi:thiol:disulfide interchange protein DsbA
MIEVTKMLRRSFFAIATLVLAAAASGDVVQGRDYSALPSPQKTSAPGKIEIIEFFSYGCPHCAEFHPSVMKWAQALPKDAVFVRVPVSFGRREWGQLVRAYYALEATGDLASLDGALFEAIHKQRKPLFNEDSLAAWVAQNGGDAAKFRRAFNSPDVSNKALRAEQLSRDYRVSGVPQLTVNGKYAVLGQNFQDMLRIADELVKRERMAPKSAQAPDASP